MDEDRGTATGVVQTVRRAIVRHPSFAIGACAGLLTFLLIASGRFSAGALLVSWNVGAALHIVLTWFRMSRATVERIKQKAADMDLSDSLVLIFSITAAVASIAGIVLELHGAKSASPEEVWKSTLLSGTTILVSWFFLHSLFTVHYAHVFYAGRDAGEDLHFPDDVKDPGYWDFVYFAFTIGAAAQTADVEVTSTTMRKLVVLHSTLSFLFNTTILALAINVGAGMI